MRPLGQQLNKLITQEELLQIYHFILNLPEEFLKISTLPRGKTYYLSKKETKLPNTIHILRTLADEFMLIVKMNKKIRGDARANGTSKKGKTVWQLDRAQTPYFKLTVRYEENYVYRDLKQEVLLSHQLGLYFTKNMILSNERWNKEGKRKADIFLPKALMDLKSFFIVLKKSDIKKQYELSLNSMITDLLNHVKTIHDLGYIHQDIKCKNILVSQDPLKGYRLELCDFGLTKKEGDKKASPLASLGSQSPEIATLHFIDEQWNEEEHKYFYPNEKHSEKSLGFQYFNQRKEQQLKDRENYRRVSKANDNWALGLVIYAMKNFGEELESIEKAQAITDPLIKGLLDPNRETRFTIDQAILVHQTLIEQNANIPPQSVGKGSLVAI